MNELRVIKESCCGEGGGGWLENQHLAGWGEAGREDKGHFLRQAWGK